MSIPMILAHGEQMEFALTFLFLAGGSSFVCALVAAFLYVADKSGKRRLQIVGVIWMIAFVLSILIAAIVVRN